MRFLHHSGPFARICLPVLALLFPHLAMAGIDADALRARLAGTAPAQQETTPLQRVYEPGNYEPLWTNGHTLTPRGQEALAVLTNAANEGLTPAHYVLPALTNTDTPPLERELALTTSLLRYIADLQGGRQMSSAPGALWTLPPRRVDAAPLLLEASRADAIVPALAAFAPPHREYAELRTLLAVYRAIEKNGGWQPVAFPVKLEPGQESAALPALAARLKAQGFLPAEFEAASPLYDGQLVEAVKTFQQRHGLLPDGTLGKRTVATLNVPIEQRIRQIMVTMEHWRWAPPSLGERHVRVNVPGYRLQAFADGKQTLTMKVIAGQPDRQTPVLSSVVTDIIFYPYWHVPAKIAVDKLLPKIQKDPDYLTSKGYVVYHHEAGEEPFEVDPNTVDWSAYGKGNFPYRLRQDPGPQNSLGLMRFTLRNNLDIYLHGTPEQKLFEKDSRALSSGCVRVEDPLTLATFVMGETAGWDRPRLEKAYHAQSRGTNRAALSTPLPTHLLYFTTWVDENSQPQFRDDIYGYDAKHIKALGL